MAYMIPDRVRCSSLLVAALLVACGPGHAATAEGQGSGDDTGASGLPDEGEDDTSELPSGEAVRIAGGEVFVDAFFVDAGLIIVESKGAQLVSRTGEVLLEYDSRAITAAAFADDVLVLADAATFTTLDGDLEPIVSAPLLHACGGVVIVSGVRFVCGPATPYDTVFSTYDALDGTLLASSEPNPFHGVPMRRVPGLDEFVSVLYGATPTNLYLHVVDPATDAVSFVNQSAHGEFYVGMTYGFVGSPGTHVATEEGLLLEIHGGNCEIGSPLGTACFVRDGELGTLPAGASPYMDIQESADGSLYGLLAQETQSGLPCGPTPCLVQRIAPVQGIVVATNTVESELSWAIVRPDYVAPGAAVITAESLPFRHPFDAGLSYEVFYVPL